MLEWMLKTFPEGGKAEGRTVPSEEKRSNRQISQRPSEEQALTARVLVRRVGLNLSVPLGSCGAWEQLSARMTDGSFRNPGSEAGFLRWLWKQLHFRYFMGWLPRGSWVKFLGSCLEKHYSSLESDA